MIFLIFLFILLLFILTFTLLSYLKPKCPGTLDPTKGKCVLGANYYIRNLSNHEDVDPKLYKQNMFEFLTYITLLMKKTDHSLSLQDDPYIQQQFNGLFYFAPKSLLKILPSDFGQNHITPYGIISFIPNYVNCIYDKDGFCKTVYPHNINICNKYIQYIGKNFGENKCFPTPYLLKQNPFYLELGLLGALSFDINQAIIIRGIIPSSLQLNYWSFIPYLADRYTDDNQCNPYKNIYFTSLLPPFNLYTFKKSFDYRFAIVVTINKKVGDYIVSKLSDVDYIHRFDIPHRMNIDPGLPNPNHLSDQSVLFDYKTDRLTILFRMNSPNPDNSEFVRFKSDPSFLVTGLICNEKEYIPYDQPIKWWKPLPPLFDETRMYDEQRNILNSIHSYFHAYQKENIHCFRSLAGVYAPSLSSFYNNKILYTDGLQAVQLAANANADNYDAWYKLSLPQCLNMNDVMVSLMLNHTKYKNSIYCNLNVLDKQKSRGISSFEIFEQSPFHQDFILILISRNQDRLNHFKNKINIHDNVYIHTIFIETGPTIEWKVPLDHQLLCIERVYLNPSVLIDNHQVYYKNTTSDLLYSMTHPMGDKLLDPIFIKYHSDFSYIYIIIFLVIIIIIMNILYNT